MGIQPRRKAGFADVKVSELAAQRRLAALAKS
jgi:hypothetical protein